MVLSSSRLGNSERAVLAVTGGGAGGGGGGVVEVVVVGSAAEEASVGGASESPPHPARSAADYRASATSIRPLLRRSARSAPGLAHDWY